jgi:signal peptidase
VQEHERDYEATSAADQQPAATRTTVDRLSAWATQVCIGLAALVVAVVVLVAVGPRLLPYQTYFVLTGSMEPTISVGALIVLFPATADDLRLGDIITFPRPDRPSELVTHRIYAIETSADGATRTFLTKGDANPTPDRWQVSANGPGWRYAFNVPCLGYAFEAMASPLARLLLVVIPALGLGTMWLIEIWRPQRHVEGIVA